MPQEVEPRHQQWHKMTKNLKYDRKTDPRNNEKSEKPSKLLKFRKDESRTKQGRGRDETRKRQRRDTDETKRKQTKTR